MSSGWKLLDYDPENGVQRWELELDENQSIIKTEYLAENDFFETNKILRDESDNHRWGDGQIAASIPMHIWARNEGLRSGDTDYIKKWLNDYDNRAFRTFKGNV